MKKKILVCSFLVLFVLLTATTAFAVSYTKDTLTQKNAASAGFTSSMRGIDYCSVTTVGGSGIGHQIWLVDSNVNRRSSLQLVSSNVPDTYYLYPTTTGTLSLRLNNYYYYNQYNLHVEGTFTSSY